MEKATEGDWVPAYPRLDWQCEPVVAHLLADIEERLAQGEGVILREALFRTTRILHLPGAAFGLVVKEFRARGALDRGRALIRRSPGAHEWSASRHLAQRDVPHASWLAWGRGPGREVLVGRLDESVRPLSMFVGPTLELEPSERRHLAIELGNLLARLHGVGLVHRDLHTDNILIDDKGRAQLIDLQSCRRPSLRKERAFGRDLAMFGHVFLLRASRSDRLRFYLAYRGWTHPLNEERRTRLRAQEQRTWRSMNRFLRRRERRSLRGGGAWMAVDRGPLRGIGREARSVDSILQVLDVGIPNLVRAPTTILHQSKRSVVLRKEIDGGDFCLKMYREPGFVGSLKRRLRGSRARRAFRRYFALELRDLQTPSTSLFVEEPAPSHQRRSLVVTRFLEKASHLSCALRDTRGEVGRMPLLLRLARTLRRLHALGLRHRDLKPENLLVEDGQIHFIDPDGLSALPPSFERLSLLRLLRREKIAADLARLNASFCGASYSKAPGGDALPLRERLRFLREYKGGRIHERSRLRRRIQRRTEAILKRWSRKTT